MQLLILTRGIMGSGKSTWVKENNLENYTICPDNIRLILGSPQQQINGQNKATLENEKATWEFAYNALETRMKRGELCVFDATHTKTENFSKYKTLKEKYRYRVICVDFSDVPLETAIKQNLKRPEHAHIPEDHIKAAYERIKSNKPPSWVTTIKPDEFKEHFQWNKWDLSEYKKVVVFGDIQGCFDPVQKYFAANPFNKETYYISVGDLLDRGPQNREVLDFFMDFDQENLTIIRGNHEDHLWAYANDRISKSEDFEKNTKPYLGQGKEYRKKVRMFMRDMQQVGYYKYHDLTLLVTHGGIAKLPENLMYIAASQLKKGVGRYEDDIDAVWNSLMPEHYIQLHGHRNNQDNDMNNTHSYNLEGKVEFGGDLRIVEFETIDGAVHIKPLEIENTNVSKHLFPEMIDSALTENNIVEVLRSNPYINENKYNDISSFNFSRRVFNKKLWDGQTVKARGLFINTKTNKIVARSYDKFFNRGERDSTSDIVMANTIQWPVTGFIKENGHLGMVGYDEAKDELVIATKSVLKSRMIDRFKKQLPDDLSQIKDFVKNNNCTLVFEVIDIEEDQHVIKYDKNKIILLDIVYRTINYEKMPYNLMCEHANTLGLEHKTKKCEFHKWEDLLAFYNEEYSKETEIEGYVFEDANLQTWKVKIPYYNKWHFLRDMVGKILKQQSHLVNVNLFEDPEAIKFFNWAITLDVTELEKGIIYLRDLYKAIN